jgi:hypothetical protein
MPYPTTTKIRQESGAETKLQTDVTSAVTPDGASALETPAMARTAPMTIDQGIGFESNPLTDSFRLRPLRALSAAMKPVNTNSTWPKSIIAMYRRFSVPKSNENNA